MGYWLLRNFIWLFTHLLVVNCVRFEVERVVGTFSCKCYLLTVCRIIKLKLHRFDFYPLINYKVDPVLGNLSSVANKKLHVSLGGKQMRSIYSFKSIISPELNLDHFKLDLLRT